MAVRRLRRMVLHIAPISRASLLCAFGFALGGLFYVIKAIQFRLGVTSWLAGYRGRAGVLFLEQRVGPNDAPKR